MKSYLFLFLLSSFFFSFYSFFLFDSSVFSFYPPKEFLSSVKLDLRLPTTRERTLVLLSPFSLELLEPLSELPPKPS